MQAGFEALAVLEGARGVGDPRQLVQVVASPTQSDDGRRLAQTLGVTRAGRDKGDSHHGSPSHGQTDSHGHMGFLRRLHLGDPTLHCPISFSRGCLLRSNRRRRGGGSSPEQIHLPFDQRGSPVYV